MAVGGPSTNEILKDQLFLGNLAAAESLEHRRKLGITHLVSVCHELPSFSSPLPSTSLASSSCSYTATHLHIPVDDIEYEDLLIHLPKAVGFIQDALDDGGRVLVHCVMGVSRSATVVAAFLMKSRKMDARSAVRYVKQRRSQIHPNYGFIKQLDTFAKCQYEPCPSNAVYRTWKKRQEQDVTSFLNQLVDTVSIIPNKLLLNSDFPEDPHQAESLLADLGITHVLSIAPADIPPSALIGTLKGSKRHYHVNVRNGTEGTKEDLLLALPDAVRFLEEALGGSKNDNEDGKEQPLVLVHSMMEVRACTVACAYLMKQRNLAPDEAYSAIEDALPLFTPTVSFSRNLELYDACGYAPTKEHPIVFEWLRTDRERERNCVKLRNGSGGWKGDERWWDEQVRRRPDKTSSEVLQHKKKDEDAKYTPLTTSTHTHPHTTIPSSSKKIYRPNTSTPTHIQPSSANFHSASYNIPSDLEFCAKDLLSEPGFDLGKFGEALREIGERSECRRNTRRQGQSRTRNGTLNRNFSPCGGRSGSVDGRARRVSPEREPWRQQVV